MAEQNQEQNQNQNLNTNTNTNLNTNNDLKFTQDDVNKLMQERINAVNSKHQKELEELKAKIEHEAELSKLSENDRIKAELEDYKNKFQQSQDEIALNNQKTETRKLLKEANLSDNFLNFVLVKKDVEQTKKNIEDLKNVFDLAVKNGVEAQIKPHQPKINQPIEKDKSGQSFSSTFNLQNSINEYYKDKI